MKSKIIAHRGLRSIYPENTTLAIQKALDLELDGVEFDLELTADRKLVAIHQETLSPINGKLVLANREAKRSWVDRMESAEIFRVDAGSWFDSSFSSLKIPAFSDLKELNWEKKTALIELKDPYYWDSPDSEFENLMVQVAEREFHKKIDFRFLVLSFNESILQKLRVLNPFLRLGLNVWVDRVPELEGLIEFAKKLDISLLQFPDQVICQNPQIVKTIHECGIAVGSYSVSPAYDDPDRENWTFLSYQPTLVKLLSLSVDYIITDFAIESLEYLNDDLRHN